MVCLQDSVRAESVVIYASETRIGDATPLHTRDRPVVSRLDSSEYLDQVSNVAILSTRWCGRKYSLIVDRKKGAELCRMMGISEW